MERSVVRGKGTRFNDVYNKDCEKIDVNFLVSTLGTEPIITGLILDRFKCQWLLLAQPQMMCTVTEMIFGQLCRESEWETFSDGSVCEGHDDHLSQLEPETRHCRPLHQGEGSCWSMNQACPIIVVQSYVSFESTAIFFFLFCSLHFRPQNGLTSATHFHVFPMYTHLVLVKIVSPQSHNRSIDLVPMSPPGIAGKAALGNVLRAAKQFITRSTV